MNCATQIVVAYIYDLFFLRESFIANKDDAAHLVTFCSVVSEQPEQSCFENNVRCCGGQRAASLSTQALCLQS